MTTGEMIALVILLSLLAIAVAVAGFALGRMTASRIWDR